MATLPLRVWWLAVALLLWSPPTQCKNFTNEDMRDNLLALMVVVRRIDENLAKHEHRSKNVEDLIKRQVAAMGKHYVEPLKGMVKRLDERLSNVETILLNKEEREKSTQKKNNEALEGITKSIQTLTTAVEDLKSKREPIEDNLTTNEDSMDRRFDTTNAKIDEIKNQIEALKKELNKEALHSICASAALDVSPFATHVTEAEKLLNRYVVKLEEYNSTKSTEDTAQLSDVAQADDAWHSKMHEEMQNQGKQLAEIKKALSNAEGVLKQMPTLVDLQTGTNKTLDAIGKSTERMNEISDAAVGKVTTKLRELSDRLQSTNEDIQQSLTTGNTLAEQSFAAILSGINATRTEMKSLMKLERVMLQTGDNVIANKKRIDYGVYQILAKVSDLMQKLGSTVNSTVTEKIDRLEASIMGNQALSHVNISSKIDTEMAAVWRQIGVMHEQLKANRAVLDKLIEQTDQYVNSSTNTMDKVKYDVESISKRMVRLSEDFNYALGRIALVTQEFSQISTGITDAIASIKSTAPANAAADPGPGPHSIPKA